jgi:gluconokinase
VILIVMGVEGSGKTTIGQLLAQQLGWKFADADEFHSSANVEKMQQGIPLTDADRAGWLTAIHDAAVRWETEGMNAVITCSALKNSYRQQIEAGTKNLKFVYLRGSYELIAKRLSERKGHFAKGNLLASQFATLEEPKNVLTVDITPAPEVIVQEIRKQLGL